MPWFSGLALILRLVESPGGFITFIIGFEPGFLTLSIVRVMVNHLLKLGVPPLFTLRMFYLVLRVVTFKNLWLMSLNPLT